MDKKKLVQPELCDDHFVITLASGEVVDLVPGVVAPSRDFSGCDLSGIQLQGANLKGCVFVGADLRHAGFAGAELGGARMEGCELGGADFSRVTAPGLRVLLTGAHENVNFAGADLDGAVFGGYGESTYLDHVDFTGACLLGVQFTEIDLGHATLQGCNATGTQWWKVGLCETNMTNVDLLLSSFTQCTFDNVDMTRSRLNGAQLSMCAAQFGLLNLSHVDLDDAVVDQCYLGKNKYADGLKAQNATFRNALITRTQFPNADLDGAVFDGARIISCTFDEGAPVAAGLTGQGDAA